MRESELRKILKLEIDRYLGGSPTIHAARFHELIIARGTLVTIRPGKKVWRAEELETDNFSKFRDSRPAGEIVYLN